MGAHVGYALQSHPLLSMSETDSITRLESLIAAARGRRLKKMRRQDLEALPQTYRSGHAELARRRSNGESAANLREAEIVLAAAHGLLHQPTKLGTRKPLARRMATFFLVECPRAVRSEWRLLLTSLVMMYGLAIFGYVAVERDFSNAYSLMEATGVQHQVSQLESLEEGEAFRGNFTFAVGASPTTAGWIMAHNMSVGVLFFAAALVPPLFFFLMATNGLMLGVYTAVAHSYGQAGSISSILWCHGVIEIQSFVLAGCAGLVLFRGLLRPGSHSRAEAMAREGRVAWRLMAPVFPLLFAAGIIEGFISPHAGLAVRLTIAIGTGILLLSWVSLAGRGEETLPTLT